MGGSAGSCGRSHPGQVGIRTTNTDRQHIHISLASALIGNSHRQVEVMQNPQMKNPENQEVEGSAPSWCSVQYL